MSHFTAEEPEHGAGRARCRCLTCLTSQPHGTPGQVRGTGPLRRGRAGLPGTLPSTATEHTCAGRGRAPGFLSRRPPAGEAGPRVSEEGTEAQTRRATRQGHRLGRLAVPALEPRSLQLQRSRDLTKVTREAAAGAASGPGAPAPTPARPAPPLRRPAPQPLRGAAPSPSAHPWGPRPPGSPARPPAPRGPAPPRPSARPEAPAGRARQGPRRLRPPRPSPLSPMMSSLKRWS